MAVLYNRIAGQSVERLAALSDGIFAVAMTLLVLDIHAPTAEAVHTDSELTHALIALTPRFVVYLMSFLTLGIFWHGQQVQLSSLAQSDRHFSWIQIAFLAAVSLTPFSTSVLAEHITLRVALLAYWLNILVLGLVLYAGLRRARHAGLLKEEVTHEVVCAIERRILVAQGLYAFGMLLSVINTYCAMAFIVLVQLNYALAPRWRLLSRL